MLVLLASISTLISLVVSVKLWIVYRKAQRMHRMLITSETMASMGKLVAPVTHDLNTNLGVCISAVSYLTDIIEETKKNVTQGTLTKTGFEQQLHTEREAADLVMLNLEKTVELVSGLKRMSIDQETNAERTFNLEEYLNQIVTGLHPNIRKTGHKIEIDCPRSIVITVKAGALTRVLNNLISNALIHAFTDNEKGLIVISAKEINSEVRISFRDNGRGMSESVLSRAFTPFFTTRGDSGGSGLGLSIVKNLVKKELQGSIECTSEIGKGTEFIITIPREISKHNEYNA